MNFSQFGIVGGIIIVRYSIQMSHLKYDIFKIKSEEIKFNAFFDYLKSFSQAGLDTLQKLESDFHKQMKKTSKQVDKLTLMKNILSSYEIFILVPHYSEIKDSCDFVQIPEFGFCIGKTFVQLIKIIKWFLKAWLKNSMKYDNVITKLQTEENKQNKTQSNICAFCEEVLRVNPYGKDIRNKRKGVAINDNGRQFHNAKKNHQDEINQLMQFKEQVMEKYTQKQISSKRYISEPGEVDILNRKHIAMKMEISNNGNVLEEILNEFNLKTQSISRFVTNSQALCMQEYKMNNEIDFAQFQQEMKLKIAQRYKEAQEKIKQLIHNKFIEFQKIRKSKLVDKGVQTFVQESFDKEKFQLRIKQLNSAIQKLKNELLGEQQLNQSLQKLLESKSIQFEEQFLNYRKSIIMKENVNMKQVLKSLKSFRSNEQQLPEPQKMQILQPPIELNLMAEKVIEKQKVSKKYGGLKKQKLGAKKKNSIKFTLQNETIQQMYQSVAESIKSNAFMINSQSQVQINQTSVQTQTQPMYDFDQKHNTSVTSTSKKFYLIHRNNPTQQNKSHKKINIISQRKPIHSKQPINDYSHVKSKLFEKKQTVQYIKKQNRQNRSDCLSGLVKKLSIDYSGDKSRIMENDISRILKVNIQPSFTNIASLNFNASDVKSLFLNSKNAQNYQCSIYKGGTYSPTNINQKRNLSSNFKPQSCDLDSKRYQQLDDSLQTKLANAIFHQLNNFKRKQIDLYNAMLQILKSPADIGRNVDVIYLDGCKKSHKKDIQLSELKKMISQILKLHISCIDNEKDILCNHIIKFCSKIGISF